MNDIIEIEQEGRTLRCLATVSEENTGALYIGDYIADTGAATRLLVYGGLIPDKALRMVIKVLAQLRDEGAEIAAYFSIDSLLERACTYRIEQNELSDRCFYAGGPKAFSASAKLCTHVLFMPEDQSDCFMLCTADKAGITESGAEPESANVCTLIPLKTSALTEALAAIAGSTASAADDTDADEDDDSDSGDNADDNEISADDEVGITADNTRSDERRSSVEPVK